MVMRTMKDLHKLCPEIIDSSQILEMRREEVDKVYTNSSHNLNPNCDNLFILIKTIANSCLTISTTL